YGDIVLMLWCTFDSCVSQGRSHRTRHTLLAFAQEADAAGEGAVLKAGKAQKFRRINVVVHQPGIVAAGDVVESKPHSELVALQAEAVLQMRVENKIIGKAALIGLAHQLLVVVNHVEGESGAVVEREGKIES